MSGEVVALVLARGGSKGLPGKNIRLLAGHPLIAWSIAAARVAQSVSRIICSTDSAEIAEVAEQYGAEVPFLRPPELATDTATDLDVFGHVAEWLATHSTPPDLFVQLRPTCPFREPGWIDAAVATLDDASLTSVRSVAPAPHPPYKMWTMAEGAKALTPLLTLPGVPEPYNAPRQSLPTVYWHTGQLDVIRYNTIRAGSMTGSKIAPLFVDVERAIDIDNLNDFRMAELVFDQAMPRGVQAVLANA